MCFSYLIKCLLQNDYTTRAIPVITRVIIDLEVGHCSRQGVPDIHIDGVIVGRLWSTRGHVPGITHQIFILTHEVDGAVPWIPPHGLIESEGKFVDRAILAVGGAGVAIPDFASVRVDGDIAANVNSAVVGVKQSVLNCRFKSVDGGIGAHRAEVAVSSNDKIRRLTKQIAALAIAEKVGGDEADVLQDGDI